MEAISIGIGGMVGGGIFAVLGLAVELAKGGTPLAFLVAGLIALLTSYSYTKLSLAFPDSGGTVRFINEGFGLGVFSGGLNNLLWVSYIIMLSLYASAFGSYAPNLFSITGNRVWDFHLFLSSVVLIAAAINYYSISVVGKIESYAVIIKLVILLTFAFSAAYGLIGNENLSQLSISHWESPLNILVGGMVIFVAYEGFELIANTAPNIREPEKNIPRSYLISVVFVIILYISIAVITVGSLPFATIAKAQDYVLAEAAKPIFGQLGFSIITIAALISTFSAINASLYGGSRVSYEIARDGEAPSELTKSFWHQPIGLAITTFLTLLIANTLKLESISTAGSLGFLLIFGMTNLAAFKRSEEIQAKKIITLLATFLCLLAMLALIFQQLKSAPTGIIIACSIIASCFTLEYLYKKLLNKTNG
ncbi:MAG: amino acid permease [Halobacteriovoraceae bacterium]|nr:amino acid permease [Halobacteriovoraceae bacterium]